jgi:hypothetical protein
LGKGHHSHPEHLKLNLLDALAYGHTFIHPTDLVYYMGEYIRGKGYRAGPVNSHIVNLKRAPSDCSRNPDFLYHKERSIRAIAAEFTRAIGPSFLADVSFVPIPPSKCRSDPDYDDRLVRILDLIHQGHPDKHVCELLFQTSTTRASHQSNERPSEEDLLAVTRADPALLDGLRSTIALFDDMLTTGRHFRVARAVIGEHKPDAEFIGLFFSRRVFE